MKISRIIVILVGCVLLWLWVDKCGADLGLGETLPFCIECSGLATVLRLILLALAVRDIRILLQSQPKVAQLVDEDGPPPRAYVIHWHRILLILALITLPLWLLWIGANTEVPGPDAFPILKVVCTSENMKGTALWAVALLFVVKTMKTLHKE